MIFSSLYAQIGSIRMFFVRFCCTLFLALTHCYKHSYFLSNNLSICLIICGKPLCDSKGGFYVFSLQKLVAKQITIVQFPNHRANDCSGYPFAAALFRARQKIAAESVSGRLQKKDNTVLSVILEKTCNDLFL